MNRTMAAIAALAFLSGCAGDRGLHRLDAEGGGPDEFSVLPVRPLEIPATLTLPEPTPGGANRTDPTPLADAVAALGGRPGATTAGGLPAGDAPLIAFVGRNGVEPDIRARLAAEDSAFRRRASALAGFGMRGSPYFRAYAGQALDAYAELDRFRASGIRAPSAPPQAE